MLFNDRPSMQEECSGEGASAIAIAIAIPVLCLMGFSYGRARLVRMDRHIDLLIVLLFVAGLQASLGRRCFLPTPNKTQ